MHLGWPHLSASVAGTPTAGKLVTPPASQAFLHDLDGNLTDDEVWTYTWDAENRLVGMQHKTTLADTAARRKLAFEYDWRGRRIRRQMFPWGSTDYSATATSDQRFVYDGWNMVGVFDGSLNLQTAYVWGLDLSGTAQGAGGVGGLLAAITGTTAQFAAYDGNGNVRALADGGTGAWSAQYEYGPFGELIRATGPQAKANPFRFSTKWHDDESDLLYYGYRYYQPGTGRWPNRDPIGEDDGPNLYAYVRNRAVNFVDIDGRTGWGFAGPGWELHNKNGQWEYWKPGPDPAGEACIKKCAQEVFGLETAIALGLIGAGQPILPKGGPVLPGSSPGTSPAARIADEIFGDARLPRDTFPRGLPSPTTANPFARTRSVARLAGRWAPIVGWCMLANDIRQFANCVDECMGR
jgi:RHS repeat-associated protein